MRAKKLSAILLGVVLSLGFLGGCAMFAPPVFDASLAPKADNLFVALFATNQTKLSAANLATVKAAQTAFATNHANFIIVAGHTDTSGSAAVNLALSARRTAAVRAALVAAGVPQTAIIVKFFGESQPTLATPNGVPAAANRRVIMLVR